VRQQLSPEADAEDRRVALGFLAQQLGLGNEVVVALDLADGLVATEAQDRGGLAWRRQRIAARQVALVDLESSGADRLRSAAEERALEVVEDYQPGRCDSEMMPVLGLLLRRLLDARL